MSRLVLAERETKLEMALTANSPSKTKSTKFVTDTAFLGARETARIRFSPPCSARVQPGDPGYAGGE